MECCETLIFRRILRSVEPYRVPYFTAIPTFLLRFPILLKGDAEVSSVVRYGVTNNESQKTVDITMRTTNYTVRRHWGKRMSLPSLSLSLHLLSSSCECCVERYPTDLLFCGRVGMTSSTRPDLTVSHRFTRRSTTTSHKCTLYATHSPPSYRVTSANPSRNAWREPLNNGPDGSSLPRLPPPTRLLLDLDKQWCHIFSNMLRPLLVPPLPELSLTVLSLKYQPSCNKYH